MSDATAPDLTALRDQLAKALRDADSTTSTDTRPSYRAADAVMPVVAAALAENDARRQAQIDLGRAAIERMTQRAEQAENTMERIQAIPRQPHHSERDGIQGRAYTRGWESVITCIDTALNQPEKAT